MYAKTKAATAEKDIPCWKMLEIAEGKDGNPIYVTPYQFKPVPPEVMRGEETFKPNEKPFYYPEDVTTGRGFIHTYGDDTDPRDAICILTRNCGMIGAWETYVTMGVIESMPLECETAPKILGTAFCKAVNTQRRDVYRGRHRNVRRVRVRARLRLQRDTHHRNRVRVQARGIRPDPDTRKGL